MSGRQTVATGRDARLNAALAHGLVSGQEAIAPRADFPLLAANPKLHYLDSAATSQKPASVIAAIVKYYETANANPHRGAYRLSAMGQ